MTRRYRLVLVLLVLWGAGLIGYLTAVAWLSGDPSGPADCAVLFTGRQQRAVAAVELFRRDPPRRALISGYGEGMNGPQLREISAIAPDFLSCCVDLDRRSLTTAGNGAETAAWAKRNACRSLRLVTDDYHLPRSLLELRGRLPDIAVTTYAVPFVLSDLSADSLAAVIGEYHKLAARLLQLALRGGFRDAASGQ